MVSREVERRNNSIIDFNTRVTIKLVIEVVVIIVAVLSMWFNLRGEIREMALKLDAIQVRIEQLESKTWTSVADYAFMERYSRTNKLTMPVHKGEN